MSEEMTTTGAESAAPAEQAADSTLLIKDLPNAEGGQTGDTGGSAEKTQPGAQGEGAAIHD